MTIPVKVLLAFCEGPHDSAFVRMVLKKVMGYRVESLKFSEMPSPFHHLFEKSVKNHAAKDMSLDMTHKFFLPDSVMKKNDSYVFLFNCGGKTQHAKVRSLLSDYIPLIEQANTFSHGAKEVAESVKYLFLYDSDSEGLEKIIGKTTREFGEIDGKGFLVQAWNESRSNFGRIAEDKAVYVWGSTPERGTLEDILVPMFNRPEPNDVNIQKIKKVMTDIYTWEVDHRDPIRSVAETEKFLKAVLTAVGQRKKPGSSLNVILEQSGLITEDSLKACEVTAGFVDFMNQFLELQV